MAYNALPPEEIRTTILKEAELQFLTKGIENTQMKDIAAAANIGRATLYRYYKQKEQLAFIITSKLIGDIFNEDLLTTYNENIKGYEQIKLFSEKYVLILRRNSKILNYFIEFDRIFQNGYPDFLEVKKFQEDMHNQIALVAKMIDRGKSDKSITSTENSMLLASVLINTITGVSQRVLLRSDSYKQEHSFSGEEIINSAIQIFLKAL